MQMLRRFSCDPQEFCSTVPRSMSRIFSFFLLLGRTLWIRRRSDFPLYWGGVSRGQLITPPRHFLAKFSSRLVDLSLARLESLLTGGESCTSGAIPRYNDGLPLENIHHEISRFSGRRWSPLGTRPTSHIWRADGKSSTATTSSSVELLAETHPLLSAGGEAEYGRRSSFLF